MKRNQSMTPKFSESDYCDLALIASIKRGDQLAYKRMYKKYVPILTRRYYTNFVNRDELNDVVMEIMMKVFENIHTYEMRFTFNSWLTALGKNYVIDYFRHKKRSVSNLNSLSVDASYATDYGDEVKFDIPCDEPEAMTAKPEVERQAKLEYIYSVIDRFPENSLSGFPKEIQEMFVLYKSKYKNVDDLAVKVQVEYNKLRKRFIKAGKNNFEDFGGLLPFCLNIRREYENSPSKIERTIGLYLINKTEGWTIDDIYRRDDIGIKKVISNINSVKKSYEQAEIERQIMNMYLKENMTYESMASKLSMDIRLLKVTIWRIKKKIVDSIDLRKAIVDISSKYTVEQLNKEGFIGSSTVKAARIR